MEIVRDLDPWEDDESKSISAQELFTYCDTENTGFITRTDMQRLCNLVPFNRQQVQLMFDSMDKERNGKLSFYEFMNGFDALVEVSSSPDFRRGKKGPHLNGRALSPIKEFSGDPYEEVIDKPYDQHLFKTDERLRKICDDLKTDNPPMSPEFEHFIEEIFSEFENSGVQCSKMEIALEKCANLQDEQLEQVYESLERRMEEEKAKALEEEKAKNAKVTQQLQEELEMKERLLYEIICQQEDLEKKISELLSEEAEEKKKNKILLKERDQLERKVSSTENMVRELEREIKELTENEMETKKRKERSWNSLSREISLEEELMAAEIDTLRSHNKRLLDEKDTRIYSNCTHSHDTFLCSRFHEINSSDSGDEYVEQLEEEEKRENLFTSYSSNCKRTSIQARKMCYRIDDSSMSQFSSRSSSISSALDYVGMNEERDKPILSSSKASWKVTYVIPQENSDEQKARWKVKLKVVPFREKTVIYPQIVDNDSPEPETSPNDICDGLLTAPERIFKIIFVGDSGVGKTSFIHRFCNDNFKTNFHTTIGIDFQVKSIVVNNRCITLQLWDTAGQERFRCISKQYYRKSDAVIVMYDITSEQTFRSIRQWIEHIKENADDGAAILILGNKVDARRPGQYFIVSKSHGARLAEECGALFFETSAKTGTNINEAMFELSSSLQEKEDLDMSKALILDDTLEGQKKWRC